MSNDLALYTLADEYQQAAQQLADMDLDPQTIADTLEGMAGALEVKATSVAMFIRNLEATAEAIDDAIDQMKARRQAIQQRALNIKSYLLDNMARTGITKIESPHFVITLRDNPVKVVVDDVSVVPFDYFRDPPAPPPELDKKTIAEALKAGQVVPGCHLERTQRVEIK